MLAHDALTLGEELGLDAQSLATMIQAGSGASYGVDFYSRRAVAGGMRGAADELLAAQVRLINEISARAAPILPDCAPSRRLFPRCDRLGWQGPVKARGGIAHRLPKVAHPDRPAVASAWPFQVSASNDDLSVSSA